MKGYLHNIKETVTFDIHETNHFQIIDDQETKHNNIHYIEQNNIKVSNSFDVFDN